MRHHVRHHVRHGQVSRFLFSSVPSLSGNFKFPFDVKLIFFLQDLGLCTDMFLPQPLSSTLIGTVCAVEDV